MSSVKAVVDQVKERARQILATLDSVGRPTEKTPEWVRPILESYDGYWILDRIAYVNANSINELKEEVLRYFNGTVDDYQFALWFMRDYPDSVQYVNAVIRHCHYDDVLDILCKAQYEQLLDNVTYVLNKLSGICE